MLSLYVCCCRSLSVACSGWGQYLRCNISDQMMPRLTSSSLSSVACVSCLSVRGARGAAAAVCAKGRGGVAIGAGSAVGRAGFVAGRAGRLPVAAVLRRGFLTADAVFCFSFFQTSASLFQIRTMPAIASAMIVLVFMRRVALVSHKGRLKSCYGQHFVHKKRAASQLPLFFNLNLNYEKI